MYTFHKLSSDIFGEFTACSDDNGSIWFKANAVTKALGLNREAVRRVDEDDKKLIVAESTTGNKATLFIDEPGLYQMILLSRKPEAKAFKRWVTHDVLPSIRKTGGYIMGQEFLGEEERKALEAKVSELSDAVAKANAGKAKLTAMLEAEEERTFVTFDMYRNEAKKCRAAEKRLEDIAKRFADPENIERFLAAVVNCTLMDARKEEFRAMDREAAEKEARIPYARPSEQEEDPLMFEPDGSLGRRSDILAKDKK